MNPSAPPPDALNALIGLSSDVAQAHLQVAGYDSRVVETQARPSRASAPVWGELRVLRAQYIEVTGAEAPAGIETVEPTIELLVAREMLRDERVSRSL